MVKTVVCLLCLTVNLVSSVDVPLDCKPGQYFDPGVMSCASCPANVSMVVADDSFSCSCEKNSVPVGVASCKRCNSTEVFSADGRTCVPRRCQKDASGRLACIKCPADYITVTQNIDGSPMREVQCVKCAKGYRAFNGRCERCEACDCKKEQVVVRDKCLPKAYVLNRPRYKEKLLNPNVLLDVVKHEYLCTLGDALACRLLGNECVRSMFSTDGGGPCRLWLQGALTPRPPGLPKIFFEPSSSDAKGHGDVQMSFKKDTVSLLMALHTSNGGLKILKEDINNSVSPCFKPLTIRIGADVSRDCEIALTDLEKFDISETIAPYFNISGTLQPLPVQVRKPNGYILKASEWSNKFGRYFVMDSMFSSVANATNIVYLRKLVVLIRIERDNRKSGHLSVQMSAEAQYATTSSISKSVTVSINVINELPSAGVLKGLEISGGVLSAILSLYGISQWRGVLRRGGRQLSLVPIMAGCVSDALYFAALFSTLHAFAAEAGTLGLTLPLTRGEENTISAFVYASLSLKIVKVAWFNWKQCSNDMFFLDWSEYNPPSKESFNEERSENWRISMVAREWSRLQVKRRVYPGFTVCLSLLIIHLISPRQHYLLEIRSYNWALVTSSWWLAYILLLTTRWLLDKVLGPTTACLPKICSAVEVSLLVFQEELYAHYVHGRNDLTHDARALTGPLSNCRVVCAPQLRAVYKQLMTSGTGSLGDAASKHSLLSRFLAAFFERALDGMGWVASERTLVERLLDIEMTSREASTTSALLYDPDDTSPSCLVLTWWGEEWSLSTFDAMVFGCILSAGGDIQLAYLVTLVIWQILKHLRLIFGNQHLRNLTNSHFLQ